MRVVSLFGGCYTIPMGLCYDGGFGVLTAELVRRLPGGHLPWGPGGFRRWESVAVAEGPLWGGQLTLSPIPFPFISVRVSEEKERTARRVLFLREGWRSMVAGLGGLECAQDCGADLPGKYRFPFNRPKGVEPS